MVQFVVFTFYTRASSTSCLGVVCANLYWSFGSFLIHYLLRASGAKLALFYVTRGFCLLQHFHLHDIIPPAVAHFLSKRIDVMLSVSADYSQHIV